MNSFLLRLRIGHGHHARLAHPLGGPRWAPTPSLLVGTARILQDALDGIGAHSLQSFLPESLLERGERPGGRPVLPSLWGLLRQGDDRRSGLGIIGGSASSPRGDRQDGHALPVEALYQPSNGTPAAQSCLVCRLGKWLPLRHPQQCAGSPDAIQTLAAGPSDPLQCGPLLGTERAQCFLLWCNHGPAPFVHHSIALPSPQYQPYAA